MIDTKLKLQKKPCNVPAGRINAFLKAQLQASEAVCIALQREVAELKETGPKLEDLAVELEQATAYIVLLKQQNIWAANLLLLARQEKLIHHFLNQDGIGKLNEFIATYAGRPLI